MTVEQKQITKKLLFRGTLKVSLVDFGWIFNNPDNHFYYGDHFTVVYLGARAGHASHRYKKDTFIVIMMTKDSVHNFIKKYRHTRVTHLNMDFEVKERNDGKKYIVIYPTKESSEPNFLLWAHSDVEFHTEDDWEFMPAPKFHIFVDCSSRTGVHYAHNEVALLQKGTTLLNHWRSYKGREGEGTTKYNINDDLEIIELGELDGLDIDFEP